MPCTKSRANTKVMYATGAGQGNGDNERYQLGQRRHRYQDDPAFTPTRRAATPVRMTRAN